MPLFKIETQTKQADDDSRAAEQKRSRPKQEARRPRPARKTDQGPKGMSVAMLGVLVGVALLAGVSIALVGSQLLGLGGDDASGGQPVPATGEQAPLVNIDAAPISAGPINADYAREQQIAFVNGQPYSMRELEQATRMARTLAKLTGEPVPNYGEQEFLAYQVRILKRQVDMILMRQAMVQEGIEAPAGPVDDLILGFIERVGVTQEELSKQMIENSVQRQDLDRWFDDSRASNTYIQQHLMPADADPTDVEARKAAVDAWLAEKWETNQILIEFYDPDQLGIGSEGG
jgi:hypothetical protein